MMFSKKHVEALISRIVKEEVDKALAVSDKRRKEFNNNFAQVFTEGDAAQTAATPPAPDPNAPAAPTGASPDATAPSPDATAGAPGTGPGAPGTGDPNAPGGGGGEPGADGSTEDDTGAPGDAGGGGGFGGFGGGGGGGPGGGGDEGGGSEPEEDTGESEEPTEPQGDPIASMVSGAQELLNQTNDPNLIMKSLKGQIQTVFAEPEHALGLVKALYDTQDSILQAVAQRLYLFIKVTRPR